MANWARIEISPLWCLPVGSINTLSLLYNFGMVYLNAVVHVRPGTKSLKLGKPSHLNLWFKGIGSTAASTEGFFVFAYLNMETR